MRIVYFVAIALMAFVLTVPALAEISKSVAVQGILRNATTGTPLTGTYSVTFEVYDSNTAGNMLSTTTQSISASGGLFMTLLDLSTLTFDKDYWLQMLIGSEMLTPRQKLTAAPYALGMPGITSIGGNIGIGTTNPSSALHVMGNIQVGSTDATYGIIKIRSSGSNNSVIEHISDTGDLYIRVRESGETSGNMILNDFGGNVGIGTTSPTSTLYVNGNTTFRSTVSGQTVKLYEINETSFNVTYLSLITPQQRGILVKDRTTIEGGLWLYGGGTASSGGIGSGAFGDIGTMRATATAGGSYITFVDGTIRFYAKTNTTIGAIGFNERMRIKGDTGYVGIGTTTPTAKLDVNGNASVSGNFFVTTGNVGIGTVNPQQKLDVNGNAIVSGNVTVSNSVTVNGNVGIGTASPTSKLDVNGNANVNGNTNINGNLMLNGNANVSGNLALGGNISMDRIIGVFTEIQEINLTNQNNYTFVGLDSSREDMYKVIFSGNITSGGSDKYFYIRPNGDNTVVNYKSLCAFRGSSSGSEFADISGFIPLRSVDTDNCYITFEYTIDARSGRPRTGFGTGTVLSLHPNYYGFEGYGWWFNRTATITNLTFGVEQPAIFTGKIMLFALTEGS